MRSILVILSIATTAAFAATPKATDVEVSIKVGTNSIPIGVDKGLSEITAVLPYPGKRIEPDRHEHKHNAITYCFKFSSDENFELLEFFSSDFGMHTVRLSRVLPSTGKECTSISSPPEVRVNSTVISLRTFTPKRPKGFSEVKENGILTYSKEWTYTDTSKPHQWGNCFSRYVSNKTEVFDNGLKEVSVMNWDEPGC